MWPCPSALAVLLPPERICFVWPHQFTLCHGGQLGGKAALLFAGANTPTDFQFGSKPCPIERQKTFILIPSLLQSQSSGMHAMTSRDTREESS